MKGILLNYYQDLSLNFMNRPNINASDDIDILKINVDVDNEDKNIEDLITYYIGKMKSQTMSAIDIKLFEDLSQNIQDFVLGKI